MPIDMSQARGGRFLTLKDISVDENDLGISHVNDSLVFNNKLNTITDYTDIAGKEISMFDHWDDLPDLLDPEVAIKYYNENRVVVYTGESDGRYTRGLVYRVLPGGEFTWVGTSVGSYVDMVRLSDTVRSATLADGSSLVIADKDTGASIAVFTYSAEDDCISLYNYLTDKSIKAFTHDTDTGMWTKVSACPQYIAFKNGVITAMEDGLALFVHKHMLGSDGVNRHMTWEPLSEPLRIPMYPYDTIVPENNICYLSPCSACFYFGELSKDTSTIEITLNLTDLEMHRFYGNNAIFFKTSKIDSILKINAVDEKGSHDVAISGDSITDIATYKIAVEVLPTGKVIVMIKNLSTDTVSNDITTTSYTYGFRYNLDSSSPKVQKIELHRYLDETGSEQEEIVEVADFTYMPCHNWRRCVMKGGKTKPEYYLFKDDSRFKEDGKTPANLTGDDGDVVVEMPKTYLRITRPTATTDQYAGKQDYLVSLNPIPDPPKYSDGTFKSCARMDFNGVHPLFRVGGDLELDADGKFQYEQKYTFNDMHTLGGKFVEGNTFYDTELPLRKARDYVYGAAFASIRTCSANTATTATVTATSTTGSDRITPTQSWESGAGYPIRHAGLADASGSMYRSIAPYKDGDMLGVKIPGVRVNISSTDEDYPSLMPNGCSTVFGADGENADGSFTPSVNFEYTETMAFEQSDGSTIYKDYHLYAKNKSVDPSAISVIVSNSGDGSFDGTYTLLSGTHGTTSAVYKSTSNNYLEYLGDSGTYWLIRSNGQDPYHPAYATYTDSTTPWDTGVTWYTDQSTDPAPSVTDGSPSSTNKLWVLTDGESQIAHSNEFDPSSFISFNSLTWTIDDTQSGVSITMSTKDEGYKVYIGPKHYGNRTVGTDNRSAFESGLVGNPNWALNYRPAVSIARADFNTGHRRAIDEVYDASTQTTTYNYLTNIPEKYKLSLTQFSNDNHLFDFPNGLPDCRFEVVDSPAYQDGSKYWCLYDLVTANSPSATLTLTSPSGTYTYNNATSLEDRKWTSGVNRIEYIKSDDARVLSNGVVLGERYAYTWQIVVYTDNTYSTPVSVIYNGTDNTGTKYFAIDDEGHIYRNAYIQYYRNADGSFNSAYKYTLFINNEPVACNSDWYEGIPWSYWRDVQDKYLKPMETGFVRPGGGTPNFEYGIDLDTYVCSDTGTDPRNRTWSYTDSNGLVYRLKFNYGTLRYELKEISSDTPIYSMERLDPCAMGLWTGTSGEDWGFHRRILTRTGIGLIPGYANNASTLTFTKIAGTTMWDNYFTNDTNALRVEFIKPTDTRRCTDGTALAYSYGGTWVMIKYSDSTYTTPQNVLTSELDQIMFYTYNCGTIVRGLFRAINPEVRDNQIIRDTTTGDITNDTLVYKLAFMDDSAATKTVMASNSITDIFAMVIYVDQNGDIPVYLKSHMTTEQIAAIKTLVAGKEDRYVLVRFTDNTYTTPSGSVSIYSPLLSCMKPTNGRLFLTAPYGSPMQDNNEVLRMENIWMVEGQTPSYRAYNCHTRLKQFFCLMMVIDGGTFDTQTGISTGKSWLSSFDYTRSTFCGRTVCLGNNSGQIFWDPDVDINIRLSDWSSTAQADPAYRVVAFNWRGYENPFGNIGEYEDGIIPCTKYVQGDASGHPGFNECILPGAYNDSMNAYITYTKYPNYANNYTAIGASYLIYLPVGSYRWIAHPFPKSGWIKRWDPVTFLPTQIGGDPVTYCRDMYLRSGGGWNSIPLVCDFGNGWQCLYLRSPREMTNFAMFTVGKRNWDNLRQGTRLQF